ncbi:hypothetical protein J6590_035443 [Homalodisca vitripennis]|nr:hypothetical protein J6590_035443 [Homalodisca vitripennis]
MNFDPVYANSRRRSHERVLFRSSRFQLYHTSTLGQAGDALLTYTTLALLSKCKYTSRLSSCNRQSETPKLLWRCGSDYMGVTDWNVVRVGNCVQGNNIGGARVSDLPQFNGL